MYSDRVTLSLPENISNPEPWEAFLFRGGFMDARGHQLLVREMRNAG